MPEQLKKVPCGIGLLAHVGASRREPRETPHKFVHPQLFEPNQ